MSTLTPTAIIKEKKHTAQQSLKMRLIRILLSCALCVIILGIVAISVFYQISLRKISEINEQLNQIAVSNVEDALTVTAKEYLDQFISTSTSHILSTVADGDKKTLTYQTLYDEWTSTISHNTVWMPYYVRSVAVVDLEDEFYTWGTTVPTTIKSYLLELIETEQILTDGTVQYFYAGEEGSEYLIAVRCLLNIDTFNLDPIGYAFTVIDFDSIVQDCYISHIDVGNATICAYLNDELIYLYSDQLASDFVSTNSDATIFDAGDQEYLMSEAFLEGTEIRLCTFQNITSTQQLLSIVFIACLVIICVSGTLIIIYCNLQIARLLQRLERLTDTINSIFQDGEYHSDIEIDLAPFSHPQIDELTVVAKAYKDAYDQTNELITENLMRKLLQQEQRFIFLQSQINPHFLYNTLDTIKILSMDTNKRYLVGDLVSSLASIMRYSLSRDMLSYVGDELKIMREYMTIQRTRFANRLQFSVRVQENCSNIELPKMILQPLVENAIEYSVEAKGTPSQVRLSIYIRGEDLNITIADTGIGLPDNVRGYLEKKDFEGLPGHGLKNVLIRLENIFKEQFKIKVRTQKGQYTILKLTICNQTQFRDESRAHID